MSSNVQHLSQTLLSLYHSLCCSPCFVLFSLIVIVGLLRVVCVVVPEEPLCAPCQCPCATAAAEAAAATEGLIPSTTATPDSTTTGSSTATSTTTSSTTVSSSSTNTWPSPRRTQQGQSFTHKTTTTKPISLKNQNNRFCMHKQKLHFLLKKKHGSTSSRFFCIFLLSLKLHFLRLHSVLL